MREAILTLHDDYVATIDENRRLALETVGVEAFHDLRVATKRERALLQFIEAIEPALDASASYRLVRPLFRAAGAVRDLHMRQAVARRLAPRGARALHRALRQRLDDALWTFSRTRGPTPAEWASIRTRLDGALARAVMSDVVPRAELHLRTLETRVEELMRGRSDLHELRIATKNLLYTLHFIGRSIPEIPLAKEREESLQKLQRMLGNWHDLEITLEEAELSPVLATAIRREKESLRRRIRHAIGARCSVLGAPCSE